MLGNPSTATASPRRRKTQGNADQDTPLLSYAGKIFNETFDRNAIVTEDRLSAAEFLADAFIDPQPVTSPDLLDSLLPQNYDSVKKYIRAQYQLWFNYPLEADWDETEWRIELGDRLKSLPIVHNLLKILSGKPTSLPFLWSQLSRKMRLPNGRGESPFRFNSLLMSPPQLSHQSPLQIIIKLLYLPVWQPCFPLHEISIIVLGQISASSFG